MDFSPPHSPEEREGGSVEDSACFTLHRRRVVDVSHHHRANSIQVQYRVLTWEGTIMTVLGRTLQFVLTCTKMPSPQKRKTEMKTTLLDVHLYFLISKKSGFGSELLFKESKVVTSVHLHCWVWCLSSSSYTMGYSWGLGQKSLLTNQA